MLQSGTEVVTKWDSFFVTKWDGSCYKVGQVLQSETDVVTKWDRCYKVRRMLLQSGTAVTKCGDCYKVGSNMAVNISTGLVAEFENKVRKKFSSAGFTFCSCKVRLLSSV